MQGNVFTGTVVRFLELQKPQACIKSILLLVLIHTFSVKVRERGIANTNSYLSLVLKTGDSQKLLKSAVNYLH